MGATPPRICFNSDYLDSLTGVLWRYQLFYYPDTKEVEMVDVKNHKTFLKRVRYDDLRPEQLFLGATVTVFSRQLKLVEYGDDYTRSRMEARSERTLAMVKPDAIQHLGKILHEIHQAGFQVNNLRVCQLRKEEAEEFYAVHRGKPFFDKLTSFMSSGRIAALELVAPDAVPRWRALIGPTDSNKARAEAPRSIRARFGTDGSFNAVHGSDAPDTAAAEASFFFSNPALGRCVRGSNSTLAIIKPHAVQSGLAGVILDTVLANFDVLALRQLALRKDAAAEFFDVFKGVLALGEFNSLLDEMVSGPCIALEVAERSGAEPVAPLRALCGPLDPDLARVLRPESLRAQFGINKIRNAIHCTDLVEDGQLEVEFFFSNI